jgi:phosphomannomutase
MSEKITPQRKNEIYNLFKAYDMRGMVPILTADIYYLLGMSLVDVILKSENLPLFVNVCRDARYSSIEFYNAFCAGVEAAGADVKLLGLGPSELMYAGCQVNGYSGAMITASHNPKDDNGCKLVKQIPQMLGLGLGLEKMRDYILEKIENGFDWDIIKSKIRDYGEDDEFKTETLSFLNTKIDSIGKLLPTNKLFAEKAVKLGRKYKIVADTANGMGGYLMPIIAGLYPSIEFVPLYWELDGNFPNHPADPLVPENMIDLKKAVLDFGADLGIAFDGDADRVFFVDETGNDINLEYLIGLFAKEFLESGIDTTKFSNSIVFVASYSRAASETITALGGAAIPSKQGHTNVKKTMADYKAVYGGEASGHHYYGDFGFMDCGSLTVALMLKILSETESKSSKLLTYWDKFYFVSGEQNYEVSQEMTIEKIREILKNEFPDAMYWTQDGITVTFPEYKFTVRASNTSSVPMVRINVETKITNYTKKIMDQIKKVLEIKI